VLRVSLDRLLFHGASLHGSVSWSLTDTPPSSTHHITDDRVRERVRKVVGSHVTLMRPFGSPGSVSGRRPRCSPHTDRQCAVIRPLEALPWEGAPLAFSDTLSGSLSPSMSPDSGPRCTGTPCGGRLWRSETLTPLARISGGAAPRARPAASQSAERHIPDHSAPSVSRVCAGGLPSPGNRAKDLAPHGLEP
jgi:hypothetical protein